MASHEEQNMITTTTSEDCLFVRVNVGLIAEIDLKTRGTSDQQPENSVRQLHKTFPPSPYLSEAVTCD